MGGAGAAPTAALVLVSLAFAWSMGAHYTGAVMGMPYGARVIRLWPALLSLAIMTLIGATFASHGVQRTVGLDIVDAARVDARMATIMVLGAFVLTAVYTYYKVPTSTIQILVFCVVGAGIAAGVPVRWGTIGRLAITWVLAPPVATALGFGGTRLLDALARPAGPRARGSRSAMLAKLLVAVGLAASFVLGANDVSNAVGVWSAVHLAPVLLAGLAGGVAMAVGAVTWGRRILSRVAFDIVVVDLTVASAAQLVQALVVFLAVTQGLFTSMNQALVGAMAGAGLARGRQTVQWATIRAILKGWLLSPVSGFCLCFVLYKIMAALVGR